MYRSPNAYLDSHPHSAVKASIRQLLIKHQFAHSPPPVTGHELVRACIPDNVVEAMDTVIAWNSNAMHHDSSPDIVFQMIDADRPYQSPPNRSMHKFMVRVTMRHNHYRLGGRYDVTTAIMENNDTLQRFAAWAQSYHDKWYKCAAVYTYVVGALCATNTPGQLFNLWPTLTTFLDDETKAKLSARARTSPVVRDENKRLLLETFYTQELRDKADQFLTMALLINADSAQYKSEDFRIMNYEYFGESPHTFDNPPQLAISHITGSVFSTF